MKAALKDQQQEETKESDDLGDYVKVSDGYDEVVAKLEDLDDLVAEKDERLEKIEKLLEATKREKSEDELDELRVTAETLEKEIGSLNGQQTLLEDRLN
ncbi:hypothetical protein NKR23_g11798 [Pleurostoma richardsiae]|uniref:Uncharacterized protein n=1 Tax=Pleurostoma richardsiae TaxID=41990 RepID=A0AA38VGF1_9PEZI|nr:hypothetical protein NKR23_g11798 [Pleurostoma richardsiae]